MNRHPLLALLAIVACCAFLWLVIAGGIAAVIWAARVS